jgi:hypothetical protein
LFIDDAALSEEDISAIQLYASERGLRVLTRDEFVERVFFRYALFRRATVIGHNLPFDLARLAIGHGPAKDKSGTMRGGFTLTLSTNPNRPHVQVKKAGARANFIRLTLPGGRSSERRNRERGGDLDDHRGYFIDTAQTAGALLSDTFSLKRLAELLETEHQKLETAQHGEAITADYLAYLNRTSRSPGSATRNSKSATPHTESPRRHSTRSTAKQASARPFFAKQDSRRGGSFNPRYRTGCSRRSWRPTPAAEVSA